MNNIDSWEAQTRELIQRAEKEIDVVETDAKQQVAMLQNRKWILEEALKAYQQMMGTKPTSWVTRLSPSYVKNHSYREVLCLIAEHSEGLLVTRNAIKLMKQVNAFGDSLNPDSIVFSVLNRSPEFVKVGKGVYRLNGAVQKAVKKHAPKRGLTEVVRKLKEKNPELIKKDILRRLKHNGFDFRGKNPKRAINIVWISLGYDKEEKKIQRTLFRAT